LIPETIYFPFLAKSFVLLILSGFPSWRSSVLDVASISGLLKKHPYYFGTPQRRDPLFSWLLFKKIASPLRAGESVFPFCRDQRPKEAGIKLALTASHSMNHSLCG